MFGRRFNLLTFAGFRIGIDTSWFFIAILLVWTLAEGYFPFYYPKLAMGIYWLMGFLGTMGLFISVVLHELGHAIVARRFNMPISQITLFIFGGVAELKKDPPSPKAEFCVAIAGPIVSAIIAICMYFITVIGQKTGWPIMIVGITSYLAMINTVVLIFNLIPAFPLDGGRVFRSILWWWTNNLGKATKIAAGIGSDFGFALIFLGLISFLFGQLIIGIWWAIMGLFLRFAAQATQTQFYIKKELQNETVQKIMTKTPVSVPPDITVNALINQYMYQSHHHLYPVTENDMLLGYISLAEVKALTPEMWDKTYVKQIMIPRTDFQPIPPETSALDALNIFQQSSLSTLIIESDGRLVGILTAQDLFKLISLKIELEEEVKY